MHMLAGGLNVRKKKKSAMMKKDQVCCPHRIMHEFKFAYIEGRRKKHNMQNSCDIKHCRYFLIIS